MQKINWKNVMWNLSSKTRREKFWTWTNVKVKIKTICTCRRFSHVNNLAQWSHYKKSEKQNDSQVSKIYSPVFTWEIQSKIRTDFHMLMIWTVFSLQKQSEKQNDAQMLRIWSSIVIRKTKWNTKWFPHANDLAWRSLYKNKLSSKNQNDHHSLAISI